MPAKPEISKIVQALKSAGIVIPLDLTLPERIAAELSKEGIPIPDLGGFCLTHYVLIWRD